MGNLLKERKGVGVIIARMQVPYLTESHKATINTVLDRHKRIIIFLGVSQDPMDFKNPYPFDFRKEMIYYTFGNNKNINILPLPDKKEDNKSWVDMLDSIISSMLSVWEDAILYGGRDSFIPYYKKEIGKYQCVELAPKDYDSGTELREMVSMDMPEYTPESAQAIIWAIKQLQYNPKKF